MKIPSLRQDEIIPAALEIRLLSPEFEHGGVYPEELAFICRFAAYTKPEKVFEIGTFNGRTSLNIAANTPGESVVYTLDLPENRTPARSLKPHPLDEKYVSLRRVGGHFHGLPQGRKIRQLYGDSAAFDFSPYAGTVDMVFIDGSHSCEYVMNDSRNALQLLREGRGTLLWHDYGTDKWPEVTRALDELYGTDRSFDGMRHIEGTTLVLLRKLF